MAALCVAVLGAAPETHKSPTSTTTSATITVDHFEFQGNTRYSKQRLREVVEKALKDTGSSWPQNPTISLEVLEDARLAITNLYVNDGYINSGAVLPEQPVDQRVVKFQIVEGRLTDIPVTFVDKDGNPIDENSLGPVKSKGIVGFFQRVIRPLREAIRRRLFLHRRRYIVQRIQYASGPPLNILRLKDELEVLRQDPKINTINAELKPAAVAGESALDVRVQEANPYQLGVQFSNRRPPSVGSTALDVLASDQDVTGRGDRLFLRYDVLSGPIDDLKPEGAKDFSADYVIPITPADTTLEFNFSRTDTIVVDRTFQKLHITSQSDSTSFTLRQPLWRRPTAEPATKDSRGIPSYEFDVFVGGALRDNRTTLLGRPFSFSPGDINGTEHITALRFGQELTVRNERDAFSGRSTFGLGVPWFDSTANHPGGRFLDWVGQAQYVHLIGKTDIQAVFRGTAQFSDRSLLTLEQFALGGVETVRGYPENYLVRDQAVVGNVEFHVPAWRKNGNDLVTLVPFYDAGYGMNRVHRTGRSEALDAVGLGLLLNPSRHVNVQLYYGAALQHHDSDSHDVENLGFHFNVSLFLF